MTTPKTTTTTLRLRLFDDADYSAFAGAERFANDDLPYIAYGEALEGEALALARKASPGYDEADLAPTVILDAKGLSVLVGSASYGFAEYVEAFGELPVFESNESEVERLTDVIRRLVGERATARTEAANLAADLARVRERADADAEVESLRASLSFARSERVRERLASSTALLSYAVERYGSVEPVAYELVRRRSLVSIGEAFGDVLDAALADFDRSGGERRAVGLR